MRTSNYFGEMTTGVINVNDLAKIRGTLQGNTNNTLTLCIRMKKNEIAKYLEVTIIINDNCNITLDADRQDSQQITCPGEWTEVVMEPTIIAECAMYGNRGLVYSYTVVVAITAYTAVSLASNIRTNTRLYEDTKLTDFKLCTSDGNIAVHKLVLATHSDAFKATLRGMWKEAEENSINIDGATLQTLQHLKDFMYLGTLPEDGLEQLLIIAGRYLMEVLEEKCISKLITTLKPDKFDNLIVFACQNNLPRLMRALVLRIPDDIVNGIHKLEVKKAVAAKKEEK